MSTVSFESSNENVGKQKLFTQSDLGAAVAAMRDACADVCKKNAFVCDNLKGKTHHYADETTIRALRADDTHLKLRIAHAVAEEASKDKRLAILFLEALYNDSARVAMRGFIAQQRHIEASRLAEVERLKKLMKSQPESDPEKWEPRPDGPDDEPFQKQG